MSIMNDVMGIVEKSLDLWLLERREFRILDMVYEIEKKGCSNIRIEHELDGLRVRFRVGKMDIEYWVCCLICGEKECIIRRLGTCL